MQDISKKIQRHISRYKSKRKFKVAALILSFAVIVSVCSSLIMPAISLADGTDPSIFDDFNESSAVELKDTHTEGDGAVGWISGDVSVIQGTTDGENKNISISFAYAIEDGYVQEGQPYVYYQFDDHITIDGEYTYGDVYDPSGAFIIGDYRLGADGQLVIKFNFDADYFDQDNVSKKIVSGKFSGDAVAQRADDESGTEFTISIGGQDFTITGFEEKTLVFNKEASNNNDGTITWKIKVEDKTNNGDLGGYKVSDDMFSQAEGGVKFTDADGNDVSVQQIGNDYVLGSDVGGGPIYIEYTTKLTDEQTYAGEVKSWGVDSYLQNSAALTSPNNETLTTDKTVYYSFGYDVSKSSSVDYENEKVEFTIGIENKYNRSLKDFVLEDDAFNGLTVATEGTNEALTADIVLPEGVEGKIEGSKLTITADNRTDPDDLTFTYSITPNINDSDANTVNLYRPNDSETPVDSETINWEYKPITIKKSYQKSGGNSIIWTINLDNQSGSLSSYIIEDSLTSEIDEGSIKAYACSASTQWQTLDVDINCTTENGKTKITIADTDNNNNIDLSSIYITYTTSYDPDNNYAPLTQDPSDDTKYSLYNEATISGEDGIIGETNVTAQIVRNDKVTKSADSSEVLASDSNGNDSEIEIHWTVLLDQEKGGFVSSEGYTYEDSIDSSAVPQTISADQLGNLKIEALFDGDSNYYDVTDEAFYEVSRESDGSGFDLRITSGEYTFSGSSVSGKILSDVVQLKLSYSTTADVSNLEYDDAVSIKNTGTFKNKTDEGIYPYTRIDKNNAPYSKTYEDQKDAYVKVSDLPTVTVEGVTYYRFDYTVVYDGSVSSNIRLEDTIPDGFKQYDSVTITRYYGGSSQTTYHSSPDQWGTGYTLSDDEKTLYFNLYDPYAIKWEIEYSLIVDKETLDTMAENGEIIENKLKIADSDVYPEISQTINLDYSEADLPAIEKSGSQALNAQGSEWPGYYKYTVDINPDAALLTGDINGKLSVTDNILSEGELKLSNIGGESSLSAGSFAFDASLYDIQLYEVDSDGNRIQEITDFKYTFETNPSTHEIISSEARSVTPPVGWDSFSEWYAFDDYIPGTKATIDVYVVSDTATTLSAASYFYNKTSGAAGDVISNGLSVDCNEQVTIIDSDGNEVTAYKGTFTIEIPSGADTSAWAVGIASYDMSLTKMMTLSCEGDVTESIARLNVTNIPDGKHLQLVYTYNISIDENYPSTDVTCGAVNTADLGVPNNNELSASDKTSTSHDTIQIQSRSQVTGESSRYFSLSKVDVGDYQLKMSAGFNLYRYQNGQWQQAVSITKNASSANVLDITWGDIDSSVKDVLQTPANGELILNLEAGVLYKLVETSVPTVTDETYIQLAEPRYFSYERLPNEMPSDVTDCKLVTGNSEYPVQNAKEIDITVSKEWYGSNWNDYQSVTARLYRSTQNVSSGLPAESYLERLDINGNVIAYDAEDSGDNVFTVTSDGYKWEKLPSGSDDGKVYYYYVEEISVTKSDGTNELMADSGFNVTYNGNAASNEDSDIKIINFKGIGVKKTWLSINNTETSAPSNIDSITVNIYSTTSKNDLSIEGKNPVSTVELNASNDWHTSDITLPPVDSDGNPLYYFAVEANVPEGYTVSYSHEYVESTGIITVYNKTNNNNPEIVLPETGGTGVKVIEIAGAAAACTATVFLVTKRRKTARNKKR